MESIWKFGEVLVETPMGTVTYVLALGEPVFRVDYRDRSWQHFARLYEACEAVESYKRLTDEDIAAFERGVDEGFMACIEARRAAG